MPQIIPMSPSFYRIRNTSINNFNIIPITITSHTVIVTRLPVIRYIPYLISFTGPRSNVASAYKCVISFR